MTDLRDIQIVDNTFNLRHTISQNEELTKLNRNLLYLAAATYISLIAISIYYYSQNYTAKKEN